MTPMNLIVSGPAIARLSSGVPQRMSSANFGVCVLWNRFCASNTALSLSTGTDLPAHAPI